MKTIIHTVQIHVVQEEVYRALTVEVGVTAWWTTKATLQPGEGGVIRFTFQGEFHPEMKQTRLENGRLVEWRCIGGHTNGKRSEPAKRSRPLAGRVGGGPVGRVRSDGPSCSTRSYAL